MSWVKVQGRCTPLADDVRVAFREGDKVRHTGNAINIGIGFNVMEKLGWNADMRVDLFWGDGKDEGWCKLVHNERGRLVLRRKGVTTKSAINAACGQLPDYIKRQAFPAAGVEFNVLGGDLLLKIPEDMIEREPGKRARRPPRPEYVKKRPDTNIGRPKKLENGHAGTAE